MDADVADLERALEAVKARSTRALANEELYQARIKELERMNRALVLQVASLGKGEAAGNVALAGAAADVAAGRFPRLRTVLVVGGEDKRRQLDPFQQRGVHCVVATPGG